MAPFSCIFSIFATRHSVQFFLPLWTSRSARGCYALICVTGAKWHLSCNAFQMGSYLQEDATLICVTDLQQDVGAKWHLPCSAFQMGSYLQEHAMLFCVAELWCEVASALQYLAVLRRSAVWLNSSAPTARPTGRAALAVPKYSACLIALTSRKVHALGATLSLCSWINE